MDIFPRSHVHTNSSTPRDGIILYLDCRLINIQLQNKPNTMTISIGHVPCIKWHGKEKEGTLYPKSIS